MKISGAAKTTITSLLIISACLFSVVFFYLSTEPAFVRDSKETRLDIQNTVETHLSKKTQSFLDKILGSGNSIINVAADLNFSKGQKWNLKKVYISAFIKQKTIVTETGEQEKFPTDREILQYADVAKNLIGLDFTRGDRIEFQSIPYRSGGFLNNNVFVFSVVAGFLGCVLCALFLFMRKNKIPNQTVEISKKETETVATTLEFDDLDVSKLKKEQPQTIACVLSCLAPEQSAEVLKEFDVKIQRKIISKLKSIKEIPLDVVKIIETMFKKQPKMSSKESLKHINGMIIAESILDKMKQKKMVVHGLPE